MVGKFLQDGPGFFHGRAERIGIDDLSAADMVAFVEEIAAIRRHRVPPFQKVRTGLISPRVSGCVNFDRLNCRANFVENEPACTAAVGGSVSDILEHDPGSPEAVAEGCTCSPVLNNDGAG